MSTGLCDELSAEGDQSLARDFREFFQRTLAGLGRRHEPFRNEPAHFVAAAVRRVDADLIENIFQAAP